MQLSNNFSLEELIFSQTAEREDIDNTPTNEVLQNLIYTAEQLELVKQLLNGCPVLISSGYRSPALNKAVKGANTSQHVLGKAVDFTAPKYGTPRDIVAAIKASHIEYDQLILEFGRWVHISFTKSNNRKEALIIDRLGTRNFT